MARKPVRKGSRAAGSSARPTPIHSRYPTPAGSTYPSTYASEAETDLDHQVSQLPLEALTLTDPAEQIAAEIDKEKEKAAKKKKQPFRFMDLPYELRIEVYTHFFADVERVVDLDADNHKAIHKKLSMLRTSRAIYHEVSHFFYTTHTFRIFPTVGKYFKAKKPLLARLNKRQRSLITSLELRLGPGWNKPPRGWVVNDALGLVDCVNLRRLTVFVQFDPSDNLYSGFRRADGFYESFSQELLRGVLKGLPSLDRVHFDAWPGVKKSGAMMRGLFELTLSQGKTICWGPERGWTDAEEVEPEVEPVDTPASNMGHGTIPPALLHNIGMNIAVVA